MSDNPLSGKPTLDTTDFKTAISEMNRDIRVIESGFRASAASLGDWGNSASGLEGRIKSLNSEMEIQRNKIAALKGEYDKIVAAKGADSKAAEDLQIRINKETESLGKMDNELNKSQTALDNMGKEADQSGQQVDTLDKHEVEATDSTNKWVKAIAGLEIARAVKDAVSALLNMVVSLVKGLADLAMGAIDAAGELVDMSAKTGISVTRLQELNYIADQVGTTTDTITSSMARLVRSMDAAQVKTSAQAKAFKELGVSTTNADGTMRSAEDVFNDLITALGKIENPTERDALAMQLFGKSAQELNPLIVAGADELARLTDEAHKNGAVMGEDNVYALEAFGDTLAGLKGSFQGIIGTIAAAFLPAFQSIASWVQSNLPTIIAWLQTALPVAIQFLSDVWTNVLLPAITNVWNWMSTVLFPFLRDVIFPWLQTNIPVALQFLSDVWNNVLLPAIQAVWEWISTVLIPFFQGTVLPWLQKYIPVALQFLGDVWNNVLLPAIQAVWAWISGVLIPFFQGTVLPWLQKNIPAAIQTLSDYWNDVLLPAIQAIWGFINTYLVPLFKVVGELVGTVVVLAVTVLAGAWQNILYPALKTIWDFISKYLQPVFKALTDFFTNTLQPILSKIVGGVLLGLYNAFKNIKDAIQWVIDKVAALIEKLKGIKVPALFQPGSPTPFEMGLRGIADAIDEINRKQLNLGLNGGSAGAAGSSSVRNLTMGGIHITINGNGDAQTVSAAAEQGVIAALRAMGAA